MTEPANRSSDHKVLQFPEDPERPLELPEEMPKAVGDVIIMMVSNPEFDEEDNLLGFNSELRFTSDVAVGTEDGFDCTNIMVADILRGFADELENKDESGALEFSALRLDQPGSPVKRD